MGFQFPGPTNGKVQYLHPLGHQHAGHGWLQLLGEIKHRLPDLPVMMITAYGDDERRRHTDDLGAPPIWRRRRCCSAS
jgi:hypothetical protein